jgi:hypothetical protein
MCQDRHRLVAGGSDGASLERLSAELPQGLEAARAHDLLGDLRAGPIVKVM